MEVFLLLAIPTALTIFLLVNKKKKWITSGSRVGLLGPLFFYDARKDPEACQNCLPTAWAPQPVEIAKRELDRWTAAKEGVPVTFIKYSVDKQCPTCGRILTIEVVRSGHQLH